MLFKPAVSRRAPWVQDGAVAAVDKWLAFDSLQSGCAALVLLSQQSHILGCVAALLEGLMSLKSLALLFVYVCACVALAAE